MKCDIWWLKQDDYVILTDPHQNDLDEYRGEKCRVNNVYLDTQQIEIEIPVSDGRKNVHVKPEAVTMIRDINTYLTGSKRHYPMLTMIAETLEICNVNVKWAKEYYETSEGWTVGDPKALYEIKREQIDIADLFILYLGNGHGDHKNAYAEMGYADRSRRGQNPMRKKIVGISNTIQMRRSCPMNEAVDNWHGLFPQFLIGELGEYIKRQIQQDKITFPKGYDHAAVQDTIRMLTNKLTEDK